MDALSMQSSATDRVSANLSNGRISRVAQGADDSQPAAVAREMESLFATLLVSELRKGLGDGFFGSGPGADTFNGWFDEQIGSSLASRSSLGLTEQIQEAILREQSARAAQEARMASEEEGS
jgi:Rod binding domain-containing protein